MRKLAQLTKTEIKNLRSKLQKAVPKPTPDKKCNWLRVQRPSRAMLICLGSGPWKIDRRTAVQEKALALLGKRDLSELKSSEVGKMFPLEWQRNYLKRTVRYAKKCENGFDKQFKFRGIKEQERARVAESFVVEAYSSNKLPKVISMFLRDYCCVDAYPVDRHVRLFLKENNLPTNEVDMIKLMRACKLSPREYARALFTNKSSNPQHPPSAKDWMIMK